MLIKSSQTAEKGFAASAYILIFILYAKVDHPISFLCFSLALLIFSFTVMRWINKLKT